MIKNSEQWVSVISVDSFGQTCRQDPVSFWCLVLRSYDFSFHLQIFDPRLEFWSCTLAANDAGAEIRTSLALESLSAGQMSRSLGYDRWR